MEMALQQGLFQEDLTMGQRFDEWKEKPGARRVLQIAYAICARYAKRHERTGRRVSMKLIWEILRDNVAAVQSRRTHLKLEKVDGFALNNSFTAHVARHIIAHRPEWDGLFEMRALHDGHQ